MVLVPCARLDVFSSEVWRGMCYILARSERVLLVPRPLVNEKGAPEMTSMWKPVAIPALACALLGAPSLAAADEKAPANPTFTKDIAPIFQAKCESCHRADSIAPMSLVTYEESRPVGAVDQDPRGGAPDAALAHRPDHRHPGVQERSLAQRRRDQDHRPLGGRGRAEGRPEGHAAAGRSGRASRAGTTRSCSDRPSRT